MDAPHGLTRLWFRRGPTQEAARSGTYRTFCPHPLARPEREWPRMTALDCGFGRRHCPPGRGSGTRRRSQESDAVAFVRARCDWMASAGECSCDLYQDAEVPALFLRAPGLLCPLGRRKVWPRSGETDRQQVGSLKVAAAPRGQGKLPPFSNLCGQAHLDRSLQATRWVWGRCEIMKAPRGTCRIQSRAF